ncbi:MAG: 5'-methylthioadenosine/S-adenosylhomocysteine nucleosidase [Chloroflexota bacterium]
MKIIVLVSANAEWKAVNEIFPTLELLQSPYGEKSCLTLQGWDLMLYHTGWGKIASAAAMQYVIDREQPDLIVNLGTCGGFEGVNIRGDIVLVERTFVYDIVELMGAPDADSYYASSLDLSWLPGPHPFPTRRGLIASADSDLPPEKIAFLKSLGAIAGDWESAALAWVARKNGQRLLILRGVTDLVNETAGEAYDNLALFHVRTKDIMQKLFEQLPAWLSAVKI